MNERELEGSVLFIYLGDIGISILLLFPLHYYLFFEVKEYVGLTWFLTYAWVFAK